MELYLMAYPNRVIFYKDGVPLDAVSYAIELHDPGSIDLLNWLNIIENRMFYKMGTGRFAGEFKLTPVSQIVPWLLAGLREAVMKELTYDLLKIIAIVKQAGFRSDELDVIEQSIIYR